MGDTDRTETAIPLVEERLRVDKRPVETGRVRIRTRVEEHLARVAEELDAEEISIERVPVNKEVTVAPPVREEGDVVIIPLLEEVIVVEKRLVVREELRIRKGHKREPIEEAVRVRRMHAEVERVPSASRGRAARIRRATPPRATPPKGAKN